MPVALAIGLGALAALAFLYSLAYAYKMSLGALIEAIVRGLQSLPSLPFVGRRIWDALAAPFQAVDHFVLHAIGQGIAGLHDVWNYFWGYTAYAVREVADALAGTAEDTYRALDAIVTHTIPAAVANAGAHITKQVHVIEKHITVVPRTVERTVVQKITHVKRIVVHEAAAAGATIPLPRIGTLERDVAAAQRKLRDFLRRVGPAAIVGSVIVSLARIGAGWVRCSKVNRAGKQICGMDEDLLQSLLADTLLIVGTVSLVEFARGMEQVTADVLAPIRTFWRAT